MDLVRNNRIEVNIAERLRRSLSFSSKSKKRIKVTEDIIDEQDPNKLLKRDFEQIKKEKVI